MIFCNFIPGSKLDPDSAPPTGGALTEASIFNRAAPGESAFEKLRRLVGGVAGCKEAAVGGRVDRQAMAKYPIKNIKIKKQHITTRPLTTTTTTHTTTTSTPSTTTALTSTTSTTTRSKLAARVAATLVHPKEKCLDDQDDFEEDELQQLEQLSLSPASGTEEEPEDDDCITTTTHLDTSSAPDDNTKTNEHNNTHDTATSRSSSSSSSGGGNQLSATNESTTIDKSQPNWQLNCKYTRNEVQCHSTLDDCWMVIFDKVYNITEFVYEHPGGDFILLEYAGRDATHPFLSTRHGSSAYKMLDKYWIGILVDEELYYSNNSSYCSVYSNLSWRQDVGSSTADSTTSPTPSSSPASSEASLWLT